tara:strand:- start:195 stop:848 length:654 start_codon:yes stop_codon:yes gene_type:complete
MVSVPVSMVCLGRHDRSDAASRVGIEAGAHGADVEFVVGREFEAVLDRGMVDWRGALSSANWLVTSSELVVEGDSMKGAWGASLVFSELEGSKTAMVVTVPKDPARMEEAWGYVIQRIRQIELLYLSQEAIEAISVLEDSDPSELIDEVRVTGMVPIVCSFEPSQGIARVSHSLGSEELVLGDGFGPHMWLSSFICGLSTSGPGPSGIASAARSLLQ